MSQESGRQRHLVLVSPCLYSWKIGGKIDLHGASPFLVDVEVAMTLEMQLIADIGMWVSQVARLDQCHL